MKLSLDELVGLSILRVVVILLVCLLAYIFGFLVAATAVYPLFILLLVTELLGPPLLAEFAALCGDQLAVYTKAFGNQEPVVNSVLFGWGALFVFALYKKMAQEDAEEASQKAMRHQAELEDEADLYKDLLTRKSPWCRF